MFLVGCGGLACGVDLYSRKVDVSIVYRAATQYKRETTIIPAAEGFN